MAGTEAYKGGKHTKVAGTENSSFTHVWEFSRNADEMNYALAVWAGRYSGPHAVLNSKIPKTLYDDLLKSGKMLTIPTGRPFPVQTIFSPETFEILNSVLNWTIKSMR